MDKTPLMCSPFPGNAGSQPGPASVLPPCGEAGALQARRGGSLGTGDPLGSLGIRELLRGAGDAALNYRLLQWGGEGLVLPSCSW